MYEEHENFPARYGKELFNQKVWKVWKVWKQQIQIGKLKDRFCSAPNWIN